MDAIVKQIYFQMEEVDPYGDAFSMPDAEKLLKCLIDVGLTGCG